MQAMRANHGSDLLVLCAAGVEARSLVARTIRNAGVARPELEALLLRSHPGLP